MRESAWYASVGGGVLALGIGSSLLTAAVVGVVQDRDRYRAEAAQPRPARTVTVTAPPSAEPSAGGSRVLQAAAPAVSPTAENRPAASDRAAGAAGAAGPSGRPSSPVPGGSSPSSPAPGTGSHSPTSGCAPASLCLRLGVAGRVITKGR